MRSGSRIRMGVLIYIRQFSFTFSTLEYFSAACAAQRSGSLQPLHIHSGSFSPFSQGFRALVTVFFFFQAEVGIRGDLVTGVQTCALPISLRSGRCGFSSPARGMSLTSAMSPIGELLKSIAFLPNSKPVFAGRACGHVSLQLAVGLAFICCLYVFPLCFNNDDVVFLLFASCFENHNVGAFFRSSHADKELNRQIVFGIPILIYQTTRPPLADIFFRLVLAQLVSYEAADIARRD